MKALARPAFLALAVLLTLSLRVELRRYAAQIDLARCQNALWELAGGPVDDNRKRELLEVSELLGRVRERLAWDPRPSFLLGSDALLRGEGAEALLRFQDSFALEERPETDLNLSRAATLAGDPQRAAGWALRAAWLSPALIPELPAESRAAVSDLLGQLERELAAGSASAIPGLP
jgi:hypothetical protein